jgi:hypothetical protein
MKRNYTTAVTTPISRYVLLDSLGFPGGRMPADFTFRGEVECFAYAGSRSLGVFDIEVTPTNNPGKRRSAGKHRIFVHIAGRRIPFGRLAQARIDTTN